VRHAHSGDKRERGSKKDSERKKKRKKEMELNGERADREGDSTGRWRNEDHTSDYT